MKTKITLSLKKSVVRKAELYAERNNQTLSEVVESYLDKITSQKSKFGDSELDSIRGIIKLPKSDDDKKESRKLRIKKHS